MTNYQIKHGIKFSMDFNFLVQKVFAIVDFVNNSLGFISELDGNEFWQECLQASESDERLRSMLTGHVELWCWTFRVFARNIDEIMSVSSCHSISLSSPGCHPEDTIKNGEKMLLMLIVNLELRINLLKYLSGQKHRFTFPMYKKCFRSISVQVNRDNTFASEFLLNCSENHPYYAKVYFEKFADFVEIFWVNSDPRLWLFSWIGRLSACNVLDHASKFLLNRPTLITSLKEHLQRCRVNRKLRISCISSSPHQLPLVSTSSSVFVIPLPPPVDVSSDAINHFNQNSSVEVTRNSIQSTVALHESSLSHRDSGSSTIPTHHELIGVPDNEFISMLEKIPKHDRYLPISILPTDINVGPYDIKPCTCSCVPSNQSACKDLRPDLIGIRLVSVPEDLSPAGFNFMDGQQFCGEFDLISQSTIPYCVIENLHSAGFSIASWVLNASGRWITLNWTTIWPSEVRPPLKSDKVRRDSIKGALPCLVSLLTFFHKALYLQNASQAPPDVLEAFEGFSKNVMMPPGYITTDTDIASLITYGWRINYCAVGDPTAKDRKTSSATEWASLQGANCMIVEWETGGSRLVGWAFELILAAIADFLGLPSAFYFLRTKDLRDLAQNWIIDGTVNGHAENFEVLMHSHEEFTDLSNVLNGLDESVSSVDDESSIDSELDDIFLDEDFMTD